jgi:hypothetical protein
MHDAHVKSKFRPLVSCGMMAEHDQICLQSQPECLVWHSLESGSRSLQDLRIVSRAKIVLPSRLMAIVMSVLHSLARVGSQDLHQVFQQQCMAFYIAGAPQQPANVPYFRIATSSALLSSRRRYQVGSTQPCDTCGQPFQRQQGVVQVRNRCGAVVGSQTH